MTNKKLFSLHDISNTSTNTQEILTQTPVSVTLQYIIANSFVGAMTKKLLGAQRQSVWIVCSRELKFERD